MLTFWLLIVGYTVSPDYKCLKNVILLFCYFFIFIIIFSFFFSVNNNSIIFAASCSQKVPQCYFG